ncbi:MAG: zinc-binding dehydrogenase [Actinobacteria bacterium]|nr:zinc-binding dehydrogenase [Actinomycetota bacterium]
MRAVLCTEIGPIDGLEIVDRPEPVAGPGMVVVDVEAAGVNYVDALFVQGRYQIKPPVPFVPGSEIAGTITEVGEGVDPARIGERVVAMCGLGGFADKVAVGDAGAIVLPANLDAPHAAAFLQSWCTARFALDNRAHLGADETVLVLGAGGGVGQATVALAASAGARVAAVASTVTKRRAALDAGAEVVFDARGRRADAEGRIGDGADGPVDAASSTVGPSAEDLTTLVHVMREWSDGGVDVALDPVGGPMTLTALRALRLFGRLLVIGFPAGIAEVPANQILLRNRSVLGVDWGAWTMADPAGQRALLDGLLADVASGRVTPAAPETRPLDGVVDALGDLLGRRAVGKLVLVP